MDEHSHCCPFYKYFDHNTNKCENFTKYGTFGCIEGDGNYCYKCSTSSFN